MACGTIFTTSESVSDNAYSFGVKSPAGTVSAFSLPRLLLSIATVLSHRPSTENADDSYWLAQTVAQTMQATATDVVTSEALAQETYTAVSNFDASAGIAYGARHGLITNVAQRPRRGRPRTTKRAS